MQLNVEDKVTNLHQLRRLEASCRPGWVIRSWKNRLTYKRDTQLDRDIYLKNISRSEAKYAWGVNSTVKYTFWICGEQSPSSRDYLFQKNCCPSSEGYSRSCTKHARSQEWSVHCNFARNVWSAQGCLSSWECYWRSADPCVPCALAEHLRLVGHWGEWNRRAVGDILAENSCSTLKTVNKSY